MYRFTFVILHYKTIAETDTCIKSILRNVKFKDCQIVVVDNFSNDSSTESLIEICSYHHNIHLIHSDKNLGYAGGQNLGYNYAKEHLDSDFICCMNNDMEILQESFIDLIVEEYSQKNFDVLGPDILSSDGIHQNPFYFEYMTLSGLTHYLRNMRIKRILCLFGVYHKPKKTIRSEEPVETKLNDKVILHGSCLVYSPKYTKSVNEAFYPHTFMFMEEVFLYHRALRNGWKMTFLPDAQIHHKTNASLNLVEKSTRKNQLFNYKNSIYSTKLLVEYLKNG